MYFYILPQRHQEDRETITALLGAQYGEVHTASLDGEKGVLIQTENEVSIEHQNVLGITPYQKAA